MSKYSDGISDRLKMDVNNWPHLFTKIGEPKQVSTDLLTGDAEFTVEMMCIHCHVKYVAGKDNRPPDPCPARTKKSELKRILG